MRTDEHLQDFSDLFSGDTSGWRGDHSHCLDRSFEGMWAYVSKEVFFCVCVCEKESGLMAGFMCKHCWLDFIHKPQERLEAVFFPPKLTYFFNWRIIALQNFVVFCQISPWISHRYTYVPSLLNFSPISLCIPPPFRLLQSPCLSSLSPAANSHCLSVLHMVM